MRQSLDRWPIDENRLKHQGTGRPLSPGRAGQSSGDLDDKVDVADVRGPAGGRLSGQVLLEVCEAVATQADKGQGRQARCLARGSA